MNSKLAGVLLILSIVSSAYAALVSGTATTITSLDGCTGDTCDVTSLTSVKAVLATLLTGSAALGFSFSASAFASTTVKTVNIDLTGGLLSASSLGSNINAGIYIDPNIAATFVIKGATTAGTSVISAASGNTTAIVVGAGSTLQVTSGQVQTQGDVVVNGALQIAASSGTTANSLVIQSTSTATGSLTTSSSTSASANSGVSVGQSSSLTVQGNVNLAVALSVAASAVLTFGAQAQVAAAATITGTVKSANSAAVYTQSQATLALAAGTGVITAASVVLDNSASLIGQGKIDASLTVQASASVNVGNSPGTVYVTGDYNMQSSTSSFNLEVESATSFDKLVITGNAQLNGILTVTTLGNYIPSASETYNFLTHRSRSGQFKIVKGSHTSDINKYDVGYGSQTITSATYTGSAAAVAVSFTVMILAALFTLL